MPKEQILRLFHGKIREELESIQFEDIQEIRMRAERPVICIQNGKERILNEVVTLSDLKQIVEAVCGYSGYAFEEEISQGYLTIAGGHRIGLAGRVVQKEGKIQTIKYLSALNIRVAHPVIGCAEKWDAYFYKNRKPCHTLIVSPPGCGKTTLLRDVLRMFSQGTEKYQGVTVGVVDERSEIAGTYRGRANYDLGMRTDILDGCPKAIGMELLLRTMSPAVIAVDEIGIGDVGAIENALRCGCKVIATLHGEKLEDYLEKPGFSSLVKEKIFERIIFLENGQFPGVISTIYDRDFKVLWEGKRCTSK